jgi:hypothetical protein
MSRSTVAGDHPCDIRLSRDGVHVALDPCAEDVLGRATSSDRRNSETSFCGVWGHLGKDFDRRRRA